MTSTATPGGCGAGCAGMSMQAHSWVSRVLRLRYGFRVEGFDTVKHSNPGEGGAALCEQTRR
jgi:hypothetical protein